MEETGSFNDVLHGSEDLLLGVIQLHHVQRNLMLEQQIGSGLAGMVLVTHAHAFCEDGLGLQTAFPAHHFCHGGQQIFFHMAQILGNSLGVQTPAAETALIDDALCGEGGGNLAGIAVLGDDHGNIFCNDAGACADGIGIQRGDHLDLAAVDQFQRLFLGLCPALKQAGGNHAPLVQHDHIFECDGRAGVGDHIIIQSFHHFTCGQHIHPRRVCLNDHVSGSFVGFVDLSGQFTDRGQFHQTVHFIADLHRRPPVDLYGFTVLRGQCVIERGNTDIYNTKFLAHYAYLRSSAFINALASFVL